MQYLFQHEEHNIIKLLPHGNSKEKRPYRRLLLSTLDVLKDSKASAKKPKQYLDEVFRSSGDICFARYLSELPREPRDIYNARATSKKSTTSSNVCQNSSTRLDEVWVLLEKVKVEEDESAELKFIRDFRVHPNFSTVLALEKQLEEITTFCTKPKEFSNFCIGPTFNIYSKNTSLTVTTYRNLKLEQNETGQPSVFIGPLLLHQKRLENILQICEFFNY